MRFELTDPKGVNGFQDGRARYLIALAREAGAEAIVSGDADLLVLDDLEPPVVSPSSLVAERGHPWRRRRL